MNPVTSRRLASLLSACIFIWSVPAAWSAATASPPFPPDAQTRCLPTGPPPENGYEPYAVRTAKAGQKLIGGVPSYLWRHGCGPTAAGMIIGYWDRNGLPLLIPGSAAQQTDAVNHTLASGPGSGTHYTDYALPMDASPSPILPDKSEPPSGDEHASHCLADFMHTSWSAADNYYGWSWFSDTATALTSYVAYVNSTAGTSYVATCWNEMWGQFTWDDLKSEINADRPMGLLVDTDADGSTDHFVTAIGWRDDRGYNEFGCFDTWNADVVRWCRFQPLNYGVSWGVFGGTFFRIQGPALAAPVVTAIEPAAASAAASLVVGITGSGFVDGCEVDLGAGITVHSVTRLDAGHLQADITIAPAAGIGLRDVTVRNSLTLSGTLAGGFAVRSTTAHYVALGGGNIFPYATPQSAAVSLAEAMAAASPGDSILVAAGSFSSVSLLISTGVRLYGGWVDNFTGRDPVASKSELELAGNVTIQNASGVIVDGFVLRAGEGAYSPVPQSGTYGGAVWVLGSSATISNCDIRANDLRPAGFAAGGGIGGCNSTVSLHGNSLRDNCAVWGGAIYLYNCAGDVTDNSIAGNTVAQGGTPPLGAAIYLENSPGISLTGNAISGNTGATNGGGIYVLNSNAVQISGGSLASNQSTQAGGGCALVGSSATIANCQFTANQAGMTGGAIVIESNSTVAVESCELTRNGAILGAGIHASGGTAHVRWNLFRQNAATGVGGACFLSSLAAGSVVGNTLDRNAAPGGGAGIYFSAAGVEVSNNIIANTLGTALHCASAPPPQLTYNDVWNSSVADYNGCVPGAGSIAADPAFADTAAADYHLGVHSPAIDAGDPASLRQDPDGSRGDLGRYGSHSHAMAQPRRPENLAVHAVAGNVILTWNRSTEPDLQSYAIYSDSSAAFHPSLATFRGFVTAADTSSNQGRLARPTYFLVAAVDAAGYSSGYSNGVWSVPTDVVHEPSAYRTQLHQNFPNPFNPVTQIRCELEHRARVTLAVFDADGRLVRRLTDSVQGPGTFAVEWNGTDEAGSAAPSGIYFCTIATAGCTATRKMVLLR